MPGKISVLLLTEDTGNDAHAVLRAVVEKLMFAAARVSFDVSQIDFERADERARKAMGFNLYRSASPDDHLKQLDLAQTIATKLLRRGPEAFVFVHIDGDRRWSERGGPKLGEALCDNHAAFIKNVLRRVRLLLEAQQRTERLERILLVLPFYSVESWLYQNTREVQRICSLYAPRHDRDRRQFQEWADAPALLDEAHQPKLKVPTFKDKYNLELAGSLPARKILALGLSFTDSVARLQRCAPLAEALLSLQYRQ